MAPFCIAGITMAMVNCRIAGSALARASLMGMHRFFSVTAASVYLIPGMYMINCHLLFHFLHGHDIQGLKSIHLHSVHLRNVHALWSVPILASPCRTQVPLRSSPYPERQLPFFLSYLHSLFFFSFLSFSYMHLKFPITKSALLCFAIYVIRFRAFGSSSSSLFKNII